MTRPRTGGAGMQVLPVTGMQVLVLEDDDSIRRMVTVLLEARGFMVAATASGKDAVERAQVRTPDLAVCDLAVPGLWDGFEVIRRLRAGPTTSKVPIIVLSARDDDESRRRAAEAGCDAFLAKPFSPSALLQELDAVRLRPRR
jgi:DNA-binding response OmpR family regulator